MKASSEQRALRILSGEARGFAPSIARASLCFIEPFYAIAMRVRNGLYNRGLKSQFALSKPTVSVGNLTTGGTGKTPVVHWLAAEIAARHLHPAVLLRGYRGASSGSDEQRMLAADLGDRAIVVANPNRIAGAKMAMAQQHTPDVFILDDAFQHRRVKRHFDLVLIDASNPFGFGHVLPRGLLREPLDGLKRADAIVITRADSVPPGQLNAVESKLRQYAVMQPIFFADHVHTGLREATATSGDDRSRPIETLSIRPFFAFAGIGNPATLRDQLARFSRAFVGFRAFADHHAYDIDNLRTLEADALAAGAEMLVTTEKDWVKIADKSAGLTLPILRLDLRIVFRDNGGDQLLQMILDRIQR